MRQSNNKKLLPKNCGREAFYIKVNANTKFRIYKVLHLFSTVGEAWLIDFFVSYRDLKRFRAFFKFKFENSIGIDCCADEGIEIMERLKKHGVCDLSKYFKNIR